MLKKQVKDICTKTIIAVPPGITVTEAIGVMQTNKVSCALVFEDEKLVGILTERIIVFHVANRALDFSTCRVQEIMRTEVLTAHDNTYIYEAFALLTAQNIRHLVVVDERRKTIGIVTHSNLVEHLVYEDFLDVKTVSQIMTRVVCSVSQNHTVHEAFIEMAEKSISCVIVTDDGHPIGILTERDVARLVTSRMDIYKEKVGDVMSTPPVTIAKNVIAYDAASIMKQNGIRRLIATAEDGKVEGVITQTDIIRGLEGKYIQILKEFIAEKDMIIQETQRDLYNKTLYLDNLLRSSIDMGIVATDINFRIVYFNPAAQVILGHPAASVMGRTVLEIHAQENVELSRFNRVIRTIKERGWHSFMIERLRDGVKRFIQARISGILDKEQELIGYALMLSDITDRKVAEETIRHLAYHDTLTGLPNRTLFYERLALDLSHARRNRMKLALMMIDLDRFKEINDTLGHHAGDILLTTVASRLKTVLRENDTVARVGGDEFVVILPQIHRIEDAGHVAGKIAEALEIPLEIEGQEWRTAASIGIAIYPHHGEDMEALAKAADHAMYAAKEKGRDQLASNVCFSPSGPLPQQPC